MKPLNLAIGVIILAFPVQAVLGQVSSFPYSQDFTSNPLGNEWTVSKIGLTSNNWTHSTTDGNTGACLKLTGYVAASGNENYLDLALNTSGLTFTGTETFSYEIFHETGALGDATVVVQQDASGSFVDIDGSSYSISSLTATTWTTKSVLLPSAMGNKSNVKLRLKIFGTASLAFDNLRFDNASISGGALPVQLTSFTATASRLNAELKWITATEMHNYGFEVERRSIAGTSEKPIAAEWVKVGFVKGAGTSTSPKEYTFVDANLKPGRYAYRIKQIDNDGAFTYATNAEVMIGEAARVFALEQNYPNPFNPSTKIEFTVPNNGHASLRVYNMLGQEVAVLFNGRAEAGRIHQTIFDASQLATGMYFYHLEFGNQQTVKKMLFVK